MAIEKAFAIEGAPAAVWDALWADLGEGDASSFSVEQSRFPSLLAINVDLGGMAARITYGIVATAAGSEVTASLEPLGSRYGFLQLLTLGRMRIHYEMVLVQGLSNLKNTVEGKPLLGPALEG